MIWLRRSSCVHLACMCTRPSRVLKAVGQFLNLHNLPLWIYAQITNRHNLHERLFLAVKEQAVSPES